MNMPAKNNARFGWLASYPKSGNTWMRMMLFSVRKESQPIDINEVHDSSILTRTEFADHFGIESSCLTQEEIDAVRPDLHRAIASTSIAVAGDAAASLILRKVHDRCWSNAAGERIFPPDVSRGAVYIARDPRDVAVSSTHHYGVDLAEAVRIMGDRERIIASSTKSMDSQFSQPLGSWSDHVTSWLDHAAMPVLLVRYEDMLVDSARELARVAEFLGIADLATPEAIAEAATAASFENLSAQEVERGFKERSPKAVRFFRAGRSGEGRELLSSELLRQIESDHGEVMSRLGYL